MKDFYEILGVNKTADPKAIKKAYRDLCKVHHPDVGGDEDKFKEISQAYETLSDDKKKNHYDRFGHSGGNGHSEPFGGGFGADDFFSHFSNMFGRQQKTVHKGSDIKVRAGITLEEYFTGLTKDIQVNTKCICGNCKGTRGETEICKSCNGKGHNVFSANGMAIKQDCRHCLGTGKHVIKPCVTCDGVGYIVEIRTTSIEIPRSLPFGGFIRISGKGNELYGGVSGDLCIFIEIKKHSEFEIDGNTIIKYVKLPYYDLILGAAIEVPTIEGTKIRINVPSNSQVNANLRAKGKGLYEYGGEQRGDMVIVLDLVLPTEVNNSERELLESLKKLHE